MSQIGKLLVFEGIDGVGKSTIINSLAELLVKDHRTVEIFAFPGVGEGTLGSHIYKIHHNPNSLGILSIDHSALQVLHVAAHIDSIRQEIVPALSTNDFVLLDRYWWSTLAYGVASGACTSIIWAALQAEKLAWSGILPDALFYLTRHEGMPGEELTVQKSDVLMQYEDLAKKYESQFTIHKVNNDGQIASTVNKIYKLIVQN